MTSREGGTAEGRRLRPSPSSGSVGPRNGRPRSPESHGHRDSEPVGAGLPGCGAAAPSVPGPRFSPGRRALLSFLAQGFVSSVAGWGPDPGLLSPLRSSGPWPHIRLILILARASPSGYLFFLPSTRCFSLPPIDQVLHASSTLYFLQVGA